MIKYKVKANNKSKSGLKKLRDSIVKRLMKYEQEVGKINCIIGNEFTLTFFGSTVQTTEVALKDILEQRFVLNATSQLIVSEPTKEEEIWKSLNAIFIEDMYDTEIIVLGTEGNAMIKIEIKGN